jgi:hypothetical protein
MGKTKKATKAAAPALGAAAAADIDDIFAAPKKDKKDVAGKKKAGGEGKVAAVEAAAKKDSKEKKEKGDKKEKTDKADKKDKKDKKAKDAAPASSVVEVVDPSAAISRAVMNAKEASTKRGKEVEEDKAFRDSRGDVDRELSEHCCYRDFQLTFPGKRTEEGYLVFKEAELGIDPEAGGTPLCPFDCECCEFPSVWQS